ncbi:MAG: single-stranded-DNA-specific exonuclease RecJ [Chloroflexota bacterium]|nr:single-stranded-DNA-specific exonuclease RecJ [Chloroflexota bacterium]
MISPRLEWLLPEPWLDPPAFAGFGPPVATVLARRGFLNDAQLDRFLNAGLEALHDVSVMADASVALDRIDAAIGAGDRIAIWGDYDADGMTAVVTWVVGLRTLGVEAVRYVPSRLAEGYGLSTTGLQRLAADGVRLVITCDCGIGNVAEVEEARGLGIEVIVTDHHLPGPILPRAVAVVDPHRIDCPYPDADLTGAGLAYKLASALLARRGIGAEGLAAIAAIGTVADMAPMTGESRAIVRLGLAELAATSRPGLRALLARAVEHPDAPTSRDLAYAIAPRINAAGRIAEAELAISLLLAEDPIEAERIAEELEAIHRQRKEMTAIAIEEARSMSAGKEGIGALMLRNDAWAAGIIGLVAGRLAESLARPVAVATLVDGELRGSIRGPSDFHIAAALEACAVHLSKRGGHAQAGGFSLAPHGWEAFAAAFGGLPRPFPMDPLAALEVPGRVTIDLVLKARHLDWALASQIERLAPFGPGHVEPVLVVTGLRLVEARRVGSDGRHLAMRLLKGNEAFDAIAFGDPADRPLPAEGDALDLVGTLEQDMFGGIPRLRLRLLDYAHSSASPVLARRLTPQPAVPVAAG